MALPVLAMRPFFVEKVWGGVRIAALPAKVRAGHAPPQGRIGESWEVSDLAQGSSVVDGGPFHGMTLRDVVAAHGRAITGERARLDERGAPRFPLLVKIIDAADDLSVQVHPDDAYAAAHAGASAKDEAWLVLESAPGARVLHGLKAGVDRSAFERAIGDGSAAHMLREVRATTGDLFRIPPGTVHAVGGGCLLLEVQEPSDTTFRVFDYDRTDAHGEKRALHVEQALAAISFATQATPLVGMVSAASPAGARGTLEAARFSLSIGDLTAEERPLRSDDPLVVFALDDTTVISDEHGAHVLARGASCIVPPHARARARAAGPCSTIVVMAPR